MSDNDYSGLQFYSLGIVSKDKVRGDDCIEAMPIEKLPLELGDVGGQTKQKQSSLPNQHGVTKSASVKGGAVLVAKWIPFGDSNRETPPDVVSGETVMIWSYADTNDYYWTTTFREPSLRRQETVRYVYSNQPSGRAKYGEDTSYWLEWSTDDKHIRLHTSINDGEPAMYDLTINTKEGSIELKDDLGNSIFLDSVRGDLTTTTENSVTVNTKKYTINASESVEINTPKYTLNGDTTEINGDTHTVNSAATFTKGMSVSGGSGASMSITGDIEFQGRMSGDGTIDTTGDISSSGEVHGTNI